MKIITEKIGDLGEVFAGYQLALVFNGESQKETLKGEGKGALDYQLKFLSPYNKNHRQIGVQVKTGDSYGTWVKRINKWRIKVDTGHVNRWRENNQPVVLIWIKPGKRLKVFWKFFGKKTSNEIIYIAKSHELNPSSRFEIDRLIELESRVNVNIPQFTVKQYSDVKEAVLKSKKKYYKIRGVKKTAFGLIGLSNYAFRHLTRNGRNRKHVLDSLKILPYVDEFLNYSPNNIITMSQDIISVNNEYLVKRKVLLIYKNVRFSDVGLKDLFIRLDEKVIFPKSWKEKSLIDQRVKHSLILESVYRK